MKPFIELPVFLADHHPWTPNPHPIWPFSVFSIRRNIGKYPFPTKLEESQAHQLYDFIKNVISSAPSFQEPFILKSDELSPLDREFLFEHFLGFDPLQNPMPGEGFFFDKQCRLFGILNAQDHLQLNWIDTKGDWEKSYNEFLKVEEELGNALDFAFLPKFGYLTADLGNAGTALTAAIYLHLPSLIHQGHLMEALNQGKEEEVTATGMAGSLGDFMGDIVILRNRYSLGLSEETILHALQMTASKLIAAERASRELAKVENNLYFRDLVGRAYGLLTYARQINTKEALAAISLIKLGVDLSWIDGVTDHDLNALFFRNRRAHLSRFLGEKNIGSAEIGIKRAEYLRKSLQSLRLKSV